VFGNVIDIVDEIKCCLLLRNKRYYFYRGGLLPFRKEIKIMIYVVRTTAAYPSYLSAYYGDATKEDGTEWTFSDTASYTGEDRAQQFNKIEAEHIVKELKELGVSAELA
jgi:hypothetical protein|tara:strand:- start:189 stop:515 length:327 start_codon:yes stop_codon:yes gene_type:complete